MVPRDTWSILFREIGLITKLGVNSKRASIGYHMSDFGLISAFRLPPEKVAKVPIADSCTATIAASFEQLVGTNEERQRHLKPERPGSLEVDDQLYLGGLLD